MKTKKATTPKCFHVVFTVKRQITHKKGAGGDDEQMFVASCFTTSSSTESWLIYSSCTKHMSYDHELFKELHQTVVSRVRIGNRAYIVVEGKRTIGIESHTCLKFISDVLYVLEINQNLLSVAQLFEKKI
ncbi:Retrovirus-related Pol polyprotein from transposon TNT 1-94 [Gossypium australe]|uniref:Retrovirus-related Pol polyprotein from transposon TNT 1-94 n=1 Tax=Gossypium australe TaxID=47621 RepID=A0A5B6W5R2_9ROSI|nr:Retrovirus-related Pol polyprotein from transposon TNT 1-94 [Gossypium australe]